MRNISLLVLLVLTVQVYSESFDYELASIDDMFQYNVEKLLDDVKQVNTKVDIIAQHNGDKLQRRAWEQFGNTLNKISAYAGDLRNIDKRVRDLYIIEIEESANEVIENINNFAFGIREENGLNNASNHEFAKKLIANILDDYINTYTGIINQCADEQKSDILSFDRNVQNVAKKYQNIIKILMAQVERCQQSTSLTCLQAASLQFRSLNKAPRDFRALTIEGYGLDVNFAETNCVKKALEELQNEREDIEAKINEIEGQSNQGNDYGVYDVNSNNSVPKTTEIPAVSEDNASESYDDVAHYT